MQLLAAILPGVTIGRNSALQSTFTQVPIPVTIAPDLTVQNNYQLGFQLSWNVTDHFLKRALTSEAVSAHLAAEHKMESDVLATIWESYVTRKGAQMQMRECLLDMLPTSGEVDDPTYSASKATLASSSASSCIATQQALIVRSNLQMDLATISKDRSVGAASEAYKQYTPYVPTD